MRWRKLIGNVKTNSWTVHVLVLACLFWIWLKDWILLCNAWEALSIHAWESSANTEQLILVFGFGSIIRNYVHVPYAIEVEHRMSAHSEICTLAFCHASRIESQSSTQISIVSDQVEQASRFASCKSYKSGMAKHVRIYDGTNAEGKTNSDKTENQGNAGCVFGNAHVKVDIWAININKATSMPWWGQIQCKVFHWLQYGAS